MSQTNTPSGAEPHCAHCKSFEPDCIDCEDALNASRKTSGADVDVLAFFDDAVKIWSDAYTGANADTIGGVTMESVKEACARIEGRLRNARETRTAVAALIARNAELEAERDALAAKNVSLTERLKVWKRARHNAAFERDALAAANRAMRGDE